jgi:hypothetical protein
MDYFILYSNFSEACVALFDMFTNLQELKGVCIDEPNLRAQVIERLGVTLVPTLVLFAPNYQVLQRITGQEHIRNWLIIEHKLGAGSVVSASPTEPEFFEPEPPADMPVPIRSSRKDASSIAEEMQKERAEILKSNAKNKQTLT